MKARHPGIAAGDDLAARDLGNETQEMQEGEQGSDRQEPCTVCAEDANDEGGGKSADKRQTQGQKCQSRDIGHVPSSTA